MVGFGLNAARSLVGLIEYCSVYCVLLFAFKKHFGFTNEMKTKKLPK
jgi:hypothetical protein